MMLPIFDLGGRSRPGRIAFPDALPNGKLKAAKTSINFLPR